MANVKMLKQEMQALSNPEKAKILSRFFKCGPGEYGEGDVFLGIPVPMQRQLARKYASLSLPELQQLLSSPVHEHRLTSLFILVAQYKRAGKGRDKAGKKESRRSAKGNASKAAGKPRQESEASQDEIFHFYLRHARNINNWDLVDSSAEHIVGAHLLAGKAPTSLLTQLAKSKNLWERRIAMLSTFAYIKAGQCEETFRIAKLLLNDKHDLIHKAVGWMLREAGQRVSREEEEEFLRRHCRQMPRTMLRYALEKFPPNKRAKYLTQ